MDNKDFLDIAEEQARIEKFASAYSAAYLRRDDAKAKTALLKALFDASAISAARVFESAFMGDRCVDDRDAVLEAVKVSGWSLEHACESLRSDIDVVMQALQQSGYALQFASEQPDRQLWPTTCLSCRDCRPPNPRPISVEQTWP